PHQKYLLPAASARKVPVPLPKFEKIPGTKLVERSLSLAGNEIWSTQSPFSFFLHLRNYTDMAEEKGDIDLGDLAAYSSDEEQEAPAEVSKTESEIKKYVIGEPHRSAEYF